MRVCLVSSWSCDSSQIYQRSPTRDCWAEKSESVLWQRAQAQRLSWPYRCLGFACLNSKGERCAVSALRQRFRSAPRSDAQVVRIAVSRDNVTYRLLFHLFMTYGGRNNVFIGQFKSLLILSCFFFVNRWVSNDFFFVPVKAPGNARLRSGLFRKNFSDHFLSNVYFETCLLPNRLPCWFLC